MLAAINSDKVQVAMAHTNYTVAIGALLLAIAYLVIKDDMTERVKIALLVLTPVFFDLFIRFAWSMLGRLMDIPGDGKPWHPWFWDNKGLMFSVLAAAVVPLISIIVAWVMARGVYTWLIATVSIYTISYFVATTWG